MQNNRDESPKAPWFRLTVGGVAYGVLTFFVCSAFFGVVASVLVPCDPTGDPVLDAVPNPRANIAGAVVTGGSAILALLEAVRVSRDSHRRRMELLSAKRK